MPNELINRWLTPDELALLDPILESNGWASLNGQTCQVRAAFDEDKLVGFFTLQQYPVLGPLWVDSKYRGSGLPEQLASDMREFLVDIKIRGFLVIADSIFTELLCQKFGMKLVNHPVYML
jgi:hypothetical protein